METADIVKQKQQTVPYEVLTDSGRTVDGNSGHSETEATDGTV